MHTHAHTHMPVNTDGARVLICTDTKCRASSKQKVICACKEHWEVAVIDGQIVPAEIPVWRRKAPNARVKSQPQKSPQYNSHESKLEHFMRLWEAEHLRWNVWKHIRLFSKRRNLMLFVQTRVPIMNMPLWGPGLVWMSALWYIIIPPQILKNDTVPKLHSLHHPALPRREDGDNKDCSHFCSRDIVI